MRKEGIKFEVYKIDDYNIEIRFNKNTSMFFAEFMTNELKNKDLNNLKKEIDNVVEAQKSTTYKPVIVLGNYYCNNNGDFHLEKRLLATTVYLDGTIKKVLTNVTEDWNDRDNVDLWKPCYPHNEIKENGDRENIISYTKDKYETLKFIKNKLEELKERINEIVLGKECEDFINNVFKNKTNFLQIEEKVNKGSNSLDKE